MSLVAQISDVLTRIGSEIKTIKVSQIDLVTPFVSRKPYYIGHRGAHNLYPENSMEGFRAVGEAGFAVEPDIQALADGTLVAIHDGTVDRTMTGTGAVNTKTREQWLDMRIKPQMVNGDQAMPVLWDDILNELGGRFLLVPEIKDLPSQAVVDTFIDSITSRGLQRAVIVQSYTYDHLKQVAAAGISTLYLNPNFNFDPAVVKADGIEFVGTIYTQTQANIAAIKAAGLGLVTYTVNTVAERAAQIAKGVDGMFSDDPWHVSQRFARANSAPFTKSKGEAWPHLAGYDTTRGYLDADTIADRYVLLPPRGLQRINGTASGTISLDQGWAGVHGSSVRIRATITFMEDSAAQDRWAGLYYGTLPSADDSYTDTVRAGQTGYHCLIRRMGDLNVYRVNPGGTTQLAVAAGGSTAAAGTRSQPIRLEMVITPTVVALVNYNMNTLAQTADATWRGAGRLFLTSNATGVEFSDVAIIDL